MKNHIQKYQNYLQNVRKVSDNTVTAFEYSWKYFTESGGNEQSKVADVERWIKTMNESGNSAATVKMRTSSVKSYFDYLILIGAYEDNNPFTGVKTPKTQEYKADVLTDAERHNVLSKALTDEDKATIGIMFWLGLRISEVCALKPGDVKGDIIVVTEGKGGYSRRVPITMPQSSRDALDRLVEQNNAYLFKSQRSERITPNAMYRRVSALLQESGASTTRSHSARHSAASEYVKQGKNPIAITKAFGWHSPDLLNRYSALSDDDLINALA